MSMFDNLRWRLRDNGYKPQFILDVGAEKGNWTREMRYIYNDVEYHLFEPIEYPEQRDFKVEDKVHVHNILLNDCITTVDWYEKRNTGDSMFKEITHHFNDCEVKKMQTTTLNDFLGALSLEGVNRFQNIFLKIDSQGAEIPIMKGASKLYDKIDFVLMEIPFFGRYNAGVPTFLEHIQFMDSIGFIPYDSVQIHPINNFVLQTDIVFINKNHAFNRLVQYRLLIPGFNIHLRRKQCIVFEKTITQEEENRGFNYMLNSERTQGDQCVMLVQDGYERDIQRFRDLYDVFVYKNDQDISELCHKHAINHLTHVHML